MFKGKGLSIILIWLAGKFPMIAKCALWFYYRTLILYRKPSWKAHWLFKHICSMLNYRIPIRAKLGNGMKMVVPWNDAVGWEIYKKGYYEVETVNIIRQILHPGMSFFDVGAHVGQYTIVASSLVGDMGQVHSFEPDPDTFSWLKRNVELNKLENVYLNQIALFNCNGKRALYLAPPKNIGASSLVSKPDKFFSRTCEINCLTLNKYLKLKNVKKIDMIKIDVEGAELHVLKGSHNLLRSESSPILIIELSIRQNGCNSSKRELYNFLKNKGYLLFNASNPPLQEYIPSNDEHRFFNIIAVPENKKNTILNMLN